MAKIVFSGYYGQKNIGDDGFCIVANWGSRKFWGGDDICFLAPELPDMDPMPRSIGVKRKRFRGQNLFRSVYESIGADRIVFFGGSIFDRKENVLGTKNILCRLPRLFKNDVYGLGISLGPFKTKADYTYNKEILKNFKALTFRDKESYEIAKEMNLGVKCVEAADPAHLLPDALDHNIGNLHLIRPHGALPVLGVSLCHYERYVSGDVSREQGREAVIFEALKRLEAKMDIEFRFFVLNGHPYFGDEEVTQEAIQRIAPKRYRVISYGKDVFSVMKAMSECDVFMGMRLHAIVFSYVLGVPFFPIVYHRKCADFLSEIGSSDIDQNQEDPEKIMEAVSMLVRGEKPLLQDHRDVQREKALRSFLDA